jgi:hypothetical protein
MRLLAQHQVSMVVIGGVAMIVRSADYLTFDLDICYDRSPENIERLCQALALHCPTIRSAFTDTLDLLATNAKSENFVTDFGKVDLFGEVAGLGDCATVLQFATPEEVDDFTVQVLTLEGLIKAKEAANRPKDQPHLITLRALKEMEDEDKGKGD